MPYFWYYINHAGERFRTIERRIAAANNLEAVYILQIDEREIEYIVERAVHFYAVEQHHRLIGVAPAYGGGFLTAHRFLNLNAVIRFKQIASIDKSSYFKILLFYYGNALRNIFFNVQMISLGLGFDSRQLNDARLQIHILEIAQGIQRNLQRKVGDMRKLDNRIRRHTHHIQRKRA